MRPSLLPAMLLTNLPAPRAPPTPTCPRAAERESRPARMGPRRTRARPHRPRRRGLTRVAVLPVSVGLLTLLHVYVDGRTAYRYTGAPSSPEAANGIRAWLHIFLDAVGIAVDQAAAFAVEVTNLHSEWEERLAHARAGLRDKPRVTSATARLMDTLTEAPMVTAATVQRLLGVSFPAARAACEELAGAQILTRKSVGSRTTGYYASEVFDLITFAERALVSTRWDTRKSPPSRPAPSPPQHE